MEVRDLFLCNRGESTVIVKETSPFGRMEVRDLFLCINTYEELLVIDMLK